ncbi:MAG: hypothetical protein Harvfovirus13_22 [Harvfovirus sp.]|uniref:Uncharacterized protein n=1 Tax=Harvfovirus sp. TaxID=2487768 RepID=A0A3G5A1B3_9VIRU|nr:MAG: hypothetical protein Harvfovirus13_22 [Harvfovirus sp.]
MPANIIFHIKNYMFYEVTDEEIFDYFMEQRLCTINLITK